ncbi:hypothetical protein [Micromonospora sp. KC213]|uniref:hypothetical protein n=1 Tax=Micromonospora sp. KC213 TaxID=2530378 RepID=UPI001042C1F0|nr:hypothetical protein [Micromonospora sp. KC213]TDC33123.1 hypothetical protein E1166_26085 [Micromonospora sp. KC213]
MKFQRTDLIKRVQAEIGRRILAAEEANTKAREKTERERQEYVDRTADEWRTFVGNINAALDAGRPVTSEDCPKVLKDGWMDRVQLRPAERWEPPTERVPDTAALTTLLDLLEAATDDEVTTSSLERMGFRTAQLFRR